MTQIQMVKHNYRNSDNNLHQVTQTWRKTWFCFQNCSINKAIEHTRQNLWKMQEKIKYLAFLYYVEFGTQGVEEKVPWQLFKKMSAFIKTKNPNQCRIYHKRSISQYKTISHFIAQIKKKLPQLTRILQAYKDQLFVVTKNEGKQINVSNVAIERNQILQNAYIIKVEDQSEMLLTQRLSLPLQEVKIEDEKEKTDVIKTNVTCKEEVQEPRKERSQFQAIQTNQIDPFSYCFSHKKDIQQNYRQLIAGFPKLYDLEEISKKQKQSLSNQREWQECFDLYLAWTSKLSKLMQKRT